MEGFDITIKAGDGGDVTTMTQAAVILGGVRNEGQPREDTKQEIKNVKFDVTGPSGKMKIGEFTQAGIIKDGVGNKEGNSQTDAEPPCKKFRGESTSSTPCARENLGFRRKEPILSELRKEIDDSADMDYIDMLSALGKSVGCIWSPVCTGTGFRIGRDLILTCWHVISAITEKIDVVGERKGFEDLYQNSNVWLQFNYKPGDERLPNNDDRFLFADIVSFNADLDYALVQLDTTTRTLPPPITRFRSGNENDLLQFIGHNKGWNKKLDPDCKVFNPSHEEITRVEQGLHNYLQGKGLYGKECYAGLGKDKRIRFQCGFQEGASGSPGAVRRYEGLVVVTMLARGYPSFHYGLTDKQRTDLDLPNSCFIEEGIDMMAILNDIKERKPYVYDTFSLS